MKLPLPALVALQFLTRLPVRLSREPSPEEQGQSLLWYPVVGLLVGLFLAVLHGVLQTVGPFLQASLLLTLWVWLSGALHLDGLADSADAWVGGHGNRQRTLAIMKDPACGPIGVVSLVLILLLKWAALASLLQSQVWLALMLVPWVGRLLLPALLITTPYARAGGMGDVLSRHAPAALPWMLVAQGLLIVLLVLLGWGAIGLLPVMTVVLFALYWRRVLMRRLGGTTGDTAGALLELAETLLLVTLAIIT